MTKIAWKKITQFEGPEQSPGFLLWKVSTQWRRQIEATCATIGLTHPQLVLLEVLDGLQETVMMFLKLSLPDIVLLM